jgi:hypothetical protein
MGHGRSQLSRHDGSRPINVYYANFWSGAGKDDFFSYVLSLCCEHGVNTVGDIESADICLSSVFGNEHTPYEKTIFYIGENLRPDFRRARYFMSHDIDTWGGRNFYLPLWMLHVRWPGMGEGVTPITHHHSTEQPVSIEDLVQERTGSVWSNKTKFCAIICSNPEALRMNLFSEISRYKKVDGFGPAFGKPVLLPKHEILNEYKFCLCPENSYYPGYVTEKLLHAYAAGVVPIYFGGLTERGLFNRRAFVDYSESFNVTALLAQIVALDSLKDLYDSVYREPLFVAAPALQPLINFISSAIENLIQANGVP